MAELHWIDGFKITPEEQAYIDNLEKQSAEIMARAKRFKQWQKQKYFLKKTPIIAREQGCTNLATHIQD